MSEHPELPDLIRKTGVPVPQVLDRSGETLAWKPAEDMAPKLDDLIEALGARATEQTLAEIKTALTDGSLKAQLSGNIVAEAVQVANNVEVAAGATVRLGSDYIDLRAYREITAYATTTANHSWELQVLYRLGSSAGAYATVEKDKMTTSHVGAWITWTPCKTTSARVQIQNNDTVPHTYTAWYHVR